MNNKQSNSPTCAACLCWQECPFPIFLFFICSWPLGQWLEFTIVIYILFIWNAKRETSKERIKFTIVCVQGLSSAKTAEVLHGFWAYLFKPGFEGKMRNGVGELAHVRRFAVKIILCDSEKRLTKHVEQPRLFDKLSQRSSDREQFALDSPNLSVIHRDIKPNPRIVWTLVRKG